MKIENYKKIVLISTCLFFTACTWVKLIPEAEKIRVMAIDDISNCQKKGQAMVSLKAKVIGLNRGKKQVEKELSILGRNSAANIGGNVIVPASDIDEGKRTFDIYLCQPGDEKN